MEHLIACHECDLLLQLVDNKQGTKVVCPRCGSILSRANVNAYEKILAYSSAALIFFITATAFPFLSFNVKGQEQLMTLWQSVTELYTQGYGVLAALVALFIMLVPLLFLISLLYVLIPLKNDRRANGAFHICRILLAIQPWSMAEVFLIGVIVSLIKISAMAHVVIGISFWAYVGFTVLFTAVLAQIDNHQLWQWLEDAEPVK